MTGSSSGRVESTKRWTLFRGGLIALLVVAATTVAASPVLSKAGDRDDDGLSDRSEILLGTYLRSVADSDGDGLKDIDEDLNGNGRIEAGETHPAIEDTDADGIGDGVESGVGTLVVNGVAYRVPNLDVDGDGMPNPRDRDSDGDRVSDEQEIQRAPGHYPGYPTVQSNPYLADTDDDGLDDLAELAWCTHPNGTNTDGDLWADGLEVALGSDPHDADPDGDTVEDGEGSDGIVEAGRAADSDGDGAINPLDKDSDNDGLDDAQELSVGSNPLKFDTDGDGYPDGYEYHLRASGFDPNRVPSPNDTDGDGIPDGIEVAWWGTDPTQRDTDRDGIEDLKEGPGEIGYVVRGETGQELPGSGPGLRLPLDTDLDGLPNAVDTDSDNDGVSDEAEASLDRDPQQAGSQKTDPYSPDSDGDRLSDGLEINALATNPLATDTDGDGLGDGDEVKVYKTDPKNADMDGDGRRDNADDPLTNNESLLADTDGDGISNALDLDSDNDGLMDRLEDVNGNGRVDTGETDPTLRDSDGDFMWDSHEVNGTRTNPLSTDTDGDGLVDNDEVYFLSYTTRGGIKIAIATDPNKKDTDGDGVDDRTELEVWHSNPIDRDTDGDGIEDNQALTIRWTDAGGAVRSIEYREDAGSSEVQSDDVPNVLDANSDWNNALGGDHDFRDATEYAYRRVSSNGSPLHPGMVDTDGDGVSDADEIRANSDPLDARDYTRTVPSWVGEDPDQDGLYNAEEEILTTNPQSWDSDEDLLTDGEELDPAGIDVEHDGVPGDNRDNVTQGDPTDPKLADTDGDYLTDREELGPAAPSATTIIITNPGLADSDGDRIPDGPEKTSLASSDPRKPDTDGDQLLDGQEDTNLNGVVDAGETSPSLWDTDGDHVSEASRVYGSMSDHWERSVWGTDPLSAVADFDMDGFKDQDEVFRTLTDLRVADTDLDRLMDAVEATRRANALVRDTDGDYLVDGDEVDLKLDPAEMDSNHDLLLDGAEVALGLVTLTRLDVIDADLDGFRDGREAPGPGTEEADREALAFQTAGSYRANPDSRDSDLDGLPEGEIATLAAGIAPAFEPVDRDTDGDGAADAMDRDADGDWLRDGTGSETLDVSADLDGDGIPNARDGDSYDNDGLSDPMESVLFETAQARGDSDYDDDALLDGSEYYQWFFHRHSPLRTNPRTADTDRDGLADAVESGVTLVQTPDPPVSSGVGGTLGTPALDVNTRRNSNALLWDSDMDGIADAIEDWNLDGADFDLDVPETDPLEVDTDGDGLGDGTENVKVSISHHHVGTPVYNPSVDRANALMKDTDGDGVGDGAEMGVATGYVSHATSIDSDGDLLTDGVEDADHDGIVDAGETDPQNPDTDNDQVIDGKEATAVSRLDPASGGARLNLHIEESSRRVVMTLPDPNQALFKGGTTFDIISYIPLVGASASTEPLSPGPEGTIPPGGTIENYYVVVTDFVWSEQVPGHAPPDPECKPLLAGEWTIGSPDIAACANLASGDHAYTARLTTAAATQPGVYKGTLYFVASASRAFDPSITCAGTERAVAAMTPYASVELEIEVPVRYDLDVRNDDGTPIWGVANNQMRLKGMPRHAGTLTGTFQVANPNNHPDAVRLNCVARSDNNWDADVQGNAAIGRVGFRFVPRPEPGEAELVPGAALSFAPASLTDFALGGASEIVVQLNTADLGTCGAAGRIAGTVEAYRDVNQDGQRQDDEPLFDTFALDIALVSPDLDIADNQGSLVGNKLEKRVDLSKALENWTFRGSAVCDATVNNLLDAFDGPGCEGWTGLYLYDPAARTETEVQVAGAPCGEPSAPLSSFKVYKYDPVAQTYDPTKSFRVNVWSCQDSRADCGSTDEFTLKVDPSALTTGMPDGVYRPFWGTDAATSMHNGYVMVSTRGTDTRLARESSGYPVVYRGGDVNSSTAGLFDRFEVALELVNPPCAPRFVTDLLRLPDVNPRLSSTGEVELRGCTTRPLSDLAVAVSQLLREGGLDQIDDAQATLDAQAIPIGGSTRVRVMVNGAEHREGIYRGTLTLTTSEPGQGATLPVEVTVLPRCGPLAEGSIVIDNLRPGSSSQGSAGVRGCAQPLDGLSASVSELIGPEGRDRISDAAASIDATSLPVDGSTTLRISVNAAAHLAGTYAGTATVNAANGQSVQFNVQATITGQPDFEIVGAPAIALVNADSRTIFIRNTGNTDLTLTPVVPEGLPFVTVEPNPVPVGWQQEVQVTVRAHPEQTRRAGDYAGEIRFSESTTMMEKPLQTVATVSAAPKTQSTAPAVTVERGKTAKVTLSIQNMGNVNLENVAIRLGDLISTRPGGKTIAGPAASKTLGAMPLGESGAVEFEVHVDPGIFCGQYTATAQITGQAEFQGTVSEENVPVTVNITGCELRPLAFSRNPVRYGQSKSVDIAFAIGGVVTAKVYNMHGVLVRELANRVTLSGGRLTWDFKNDKGSLVASGLYLVVAQIDGKEFREKLLFVK